MFKKLIPMVLAALGIQSFAEDNGRAVITDDQKARLKSYGFTDSLLADLEAHLADTDATAEGSEPADIQTAAISAALTQVTSLLDARNRELAELRTAATTTAADLKAKQDQIDALTQKVNFLANLAEPDRGASAGRSGGTPALDLNDEQQLGGMAGEMYSLSRPYNQRARAALLAAAGYSTFVKAQNSLDYSSLKEDLGAFYRQPWQDRLQSMLAVLPTVESIFPLRSGYQDLASLVNIWLGEFSQADNTVGSDFDKVSKGSYDFSHETLRMFSVMFSHKFRDLKELERTWIGSLNREGSGVIKWSFIEFILAETAKKLHNERELRRINGVRRNPVPNVPGRAMEAADGLYEWLRKKVDGYTDVTPDAGTNGKVVYQVKPFDLPRITQGNIGEVFYLGTSMVPSVFRDTGNIRLYVPSYMIPMYHKYLETNYGQNRDYVAGQMYVHEFPNVKIVAVPNADNHERIIWTFDGNIQTFEHVAGEMLAFNIEQQDWTLKVWSNWKESVWAQAVGYKYTDRAEMDGSRQMIWCNGHDRSDRYYVTGQPNANPSVLLHTSVETVANTSPYAITDIDDAQVGVPVTIKCGADGENGVTIAKSDKFSLITEAWTPKKGDTITLMKRKDGKFIELSRASGALADAYIFAANDTTPSVAGAEKFVTGDNTKATAITDLADAEPGVIYTIHGAGSTHASTIANGAKFALTEDITLSSGHYIRVVMGADGKFYEVERG